MRYKEVLEKYGVTQIELANRLGINRVSVSRLLSNKNDMRASTIIKIANAIGCTAGELFEDSPNAKNRSNIIVCPNCGQEFEVELKKKENIK